MENRDTTVGPPAIGGPLSLSLAMLDLIVQNSLDIITVINHLGIISYESPSVEHYLGYRPDEIVGHSAFDYIHPEEQKDLAELFQRVLLEPRSTRQRNIRYMHKDKSWHLLECVGKVLTSASGQPFILINSRDITERQRADEDLRISEQRYRKLFEGMQEGYAYCRMIYDDQNRAVDWIYLNVNSVFERVIGVPEIIGKKASDAFPGIHEAYPDLLNIYGRCVRTGQSETFEFFFKPSNAWLNISVYCPEKDHFVAVFEDSTEKRKTEEANRRQAEELHQARKMEAIGRLAGGVAHELNNPLTVILGFAQTALRKNESAELVRDALEHILRESKRCSDLVQNLLTFSRKQVPGMHKENAKILVESAVALVETLAKVHKTRIERDFADAIPGFEADRTQIQQVVINLCTNAIDAMPGGGTLTVGLRGVDQSVELKVSDTGPGIPADIREKIFEPFFTTKEAGKGTGLGLSIVYDIVIKHEGTITLQSEPGRGTTFVVTFPVAHRAPPPQ